MPRLALVERFIFTENHLFVFVFSSKHFHVTARISTASLMTYRLNTFHIKSSFLFTLFQVYPLKYLITKHFLNAILKSSRMYGSTLSGWICFIVRSVNIMTIEPGCFFFSNKWKHERGCKSKCKLQAKQKCDFALVQNWEQSRGSPETDGREAYMHTSTMLNAKIPLSYSQTQRESAFKLWSH